jgi:deazaflavin-dependent oxidoreductase (nitroreductase family)
MRKIVAVFGALATLIVVAAGTAVYWRRNPRLGTRFMNAVVNPGLIRRGLVGVEKSELGMIEHIGRKSGTRRLTPVHPEPTTEGFRIVVPLGPHSEWAQNVLAAGHCRLQLHDTVYELDEPAMIGAREAPDLPLPVRGLIGALGFEYLTLHTFDSRTGTLEPIAAEPIAAEPAAAEQPSVVPAAVQ